MSAADDLQRVAIFGGDLEDAASAVERAGLQLVERDPQVVLCHGGDGTLLRAEREWPGAPKLPVRVGTRARLCPAHSLDGALTALAEGRLDQASLEKLELVVGRRTFLALNDVVLRNENPATAVRFRLIMNGTDSGELTGDGVVFATPFGSTGYYRSITGESITAGFGIALNNSTDGRRLLPAADTKGVDTELLRGPAVVVYDNDLRAIPMRDGQVFRVQRSEQRAIVLGLDGLGCQVCRRLDGSPFNPH
ncbi:MAG: NAD(+)/NADH kinase [Planctomycetota bacterium]|jgi:NAD+ kinase